MKKAMLVCLAALTAAVLCACGAYRDALSRGDGALERGDWTAAVYAYGEAVDLAPDRAEGYVGRADAALAGADYLGAIADYQTAMELEPSRGELRRKLLDAYLLYGDAALAEKGYGTAEDAYRAAYALDWSNPDSCIRLADLLMELERLEEAAALLEQGAAYSRSSVVSARLEALNRRMAQEAEEKRRATAEAALSAAPYFGNIAGCRMTAAQASAYAALIADGIRGKFQGYGGYAKPLYDRPVFWDEPYAVIGTGSYATDRASAWLGDLAGDGNPYLILRSTQVSDNSFTIYGWNGTEAVLAAGAESWGSRQTAVLTETVRGAAVMEESDPPEGNRRTGRVYRFSRGGADAYQEWTAVWDPAAEVMHVTRNGVTDDLTRAQWDALPGGGMVARASEGERTAAWGALETVKPCSLRDMIRCLNGYASALDAQTEMVEVPPDHTGPHRAAAAMLQKLFALERLSVQGNTRLCMARLLDLDGDGENELFAAFEGTYTADNGTSCRFALYRWRGGTLEEIPGSDNVTELRLVKSQGELGILGTEDLPSGVRLCYTFLSHRAELRSDEELRQYVMARDGGTAPLTESEFDLVRGRYEDVEPLLDFSQDLPDRNYTQTVSALFQAQENNP